MALRATGNGAVELYHMHTVQYTKLEAIEATLKKLREQAPQVYQRGQTAGGWKVLHAIEVSAEDIERDFKIRADAERNNEKRRVKNEKNKLLKEIIDTKNIQIYHEAIADGRINEYQKLYLHDILIKDDA